MNLTSSHHSQSTFRVIRSMTDCISNTERNKIVLFHNFNIHTEICAQRKYKRTTNRFPTRAALLINNGERVLGGIQMCIRGRVGIIEFSGRRKAAHCIFGGRENKREKIYIQHLIDLNAYSVSGFIYLNCFVLKRWTNAY